MHCPCHCKTFWNPQGRHQRRRENSNDDYYLTINVYDTLPNAKVNIFSAPPGYDTANSHSFFAKGNLFATDYRTRSTDDWNYKYYKYDVRGRVIKMWNIIADFDTLTTEYIYNSQDQITFLYYQSGKADSKSYYYEYDYTGRLKNTSYYTGPPSDNPIDYTNLASYDYNANSQVSNQNFNGNTLENTYSYNSRNWITHLESSNNIFNYANTYFKNGNVKTQNISGDYNKPFSNQVDLNYTNTYDKSNRLLSSITPAKKFNISNTYDKDGNILTLERTGSSGNVMDNFIYSYYSGTNKVSKVRGSTNQYAYDANGNMTVDSLNRNTNIKYDYRNLITQIQHKAIVNTDTSFYLTYYSYDEAGNRFAKTIYKYTSSSGPPEDSNPGGPVTDDYWDLYSVEIYSRDISGKELAIYKDNTVLEYPVYGLDLIGKIKNDELFYYYKDHLGSVRATVNSSGDVVSAQDFDAWGYLLQDRVYESSDTKFKFTSKERDTESDYDYFGYRYYDSRIARWSAIDPLFEKYIGLSPYNYVLNNPILFKDIKGADIYVGGISKKDQSELIKNLSLITGLKLYEDNGYILYEKNKNGKAIKEGGSRTARSLLRKGINSSSELKVYSTTSRGSFAILGGLEIALNSAQIENFISGTSNNLNKNTLGWGMVFLHEMLHSEIGNAIEDPKSYGSIGDAESIMNDVRQELGEDYGIRLSYQALEVYDGYKYVPFDLKTKRDLENNIIPSTSNMFIKFK